MNKPGSFKNLLVFTVSLSLSLAPAAWGSIGRTPDQGIQMIDEYIKATAAQAQQNIFSEIGNRDYTQAVATQLSTLEPEDFNLVLLNIMNRYAATPSERSSLFALVMSLQSMLADDLANTKALDDGPASLVLRGATTTYAAWIFVAGLIGWRAIVTSKSPRLVELVNSVRQREVAIAKTPTPYRLAYRAANPLVWGSMAGGAGLGYLQYFLETHRTHRINPMETLRVVQAQIACHISYQSLQSADDLAALRGNRAKLASDSAQLFNQIQALHAQAEELEKEYPTLDSLDNKDRLFQANFKHFPSSPDFQSFRKSLTDADQSHDGQCRAMSMIHLKNSLESLGNDLLNALSEAGISAPSLSLEGPKQ